MKSEIDDPTPKQNEQPKTLHDQLIQELMENRVSLTAREIAARNEIIALRELLAVLQNGATTKPLKPEPPNK